MSKVVSPFLALHPPKALPTLARSSCSTTMNLPMSTRVLSGLSSPSPRFEPWIGNSTGKKGGDREPLDPSLSTINQDPLHSGSMDSTMDPWEGRKLEWRLINERFEFQRDPILGYGAHAEVFLVQINAFYNSV